MRDILIGKSVAYALSTATGTIAGAWAVNLLTDGSIAILDNTGTLVAANASNLNGIPFVELVTMLSSGTVKHSFPLYKGKTKYAKLAYAAPVAAVKYLGSDDVNSYSLNLPSTLTVGQVVGVGIVDKSRAHEDTRRYKEYSYTVVSGDLLTGLTSRNIIVKLVALINADTKAIVTAATVDDATDATGISFTAKVAGNDFNIYKIDGVLKDADVVAYKYVNGAYASGSTTAVANVTGVGTYAQMLKKYKETASRDGDNSYLVNGDLLFSGPNQLSTTGTYTSYVFTTEYPNTDQISVQNNPVKELVVIVPSGASAIIAALDNLGSIIV